MKGKGVCFSCLKSGHVSKECDKYLVCEVCSQTQYTSQASHGGQGAKKQPLPKLVDTGAGNEKYLLSIIPVLVKSAKGDKLIKTCALLDPGSSSTFCSEQLINIFLCDMGQEQSVFCNVVAGLEITGINNHFFSLPEVYTQKRIPDNLDNIVTQEEISGQSENPRHLGQCRSTFWSQCIPSDGAMGGNK